MAIAYKRKTTVKIIFQIMGEDKNFAHRMLELHVSSWDRGSNPNVSIVNKGH